MRITTTASEVTVTGIPASVKTVDDWVDLFVGTFSGIPFSTPIRFPKLPKPRAVLGERVLRCLSLISQGGLVTPEFYPEDPEQVVNTELPAGSTWSTVPVVRRYVNARLHNVFDPEYLVLLWSKQLENFDSNDMALLPTYPKDLYNRPFRPDEVRDVVAQLRFRWSLEQSKMRLETASPALAALVDDPFGYRVLETVYEMLIAGGDRAKVAKTLQDFKKRHPQTAKWRTGFLFMGMTETMVRAECLLTEFFLSKFFYLPSAEILDLFAIDRPTQYFLAKIARDLTSSKDLLATLDLDPKTMKAVYKPQPFWYFDKARVKKYVEGVNKPNYVLFLEELNRLFFCKK